MFIYGLVYHWAGKNLGTNQITIIGTKINYGTLSKWKKPLVLKKKKIQRYVPVKIPDVLFLIEHVTIKKMCA